MNTAIAVGPDQNITGGAKSGSATLLMAAFAVIGLVLLFAGIRMVRGHYSHAGRRY